MCGADLIFDYDYTEHNELHFHVEHLIPKSKGGGCNIENLFPSCKKCNATKGSTFVDSKVSRMINVSNISIDHIINEARYEIEHGAINKEDLLDTIRNVIDKASDRLNEIRELYFYVESIEDIKND